MISTINFQIGKSGLTSGVLESLNNAFKHHKVIRISVLKSSGRDRNSIKTLASELEEKLSKDYSYTSKIIGFTIILRRFAGKKPEKVKKE